MAAGVQTLHRGVRRVRDSRTLGRLARIGLLGRGVFYILLSYLASRVALHRGGRQANANGALMDVARTPAGGVLLAVAAAGFAAFGVVRLAGACGDRQTGRWRRLSTAGQGLVYVALAAATTSFLLGRHTTGSEQQQRQTTAGLLGLPVGRWLVALVGVVVLAVCCWQIRVALNLDYTDSLDTARMPRPVRLLTRVAGSVGIVARAATFAPIGGFFLLAAARANPRKAEGLDAILLRLTGSWAGSALVLAVALGFLIFAAYTFIEAGYRRVQAGR